MDGHILVTGGAGFIGSHIVDRLIQKKNNVVIVDNLSTGHKNNINPKAKFYQDDINNVKNLEKIFETEMPDKVIHAAAQIRVLFSVSHPVYDAKINIVGGINILECCKKFNVKKIVYLSTGGALYGNPKYVPADENHPIMPISPYGLSKYVLEQYLNLYKILYSIDFISLRFSNVYGPRQKNLVVYNIIKQVLNKRNIEFDNLKPTRDFSYIKDLIDALILIAKRGGNEIYNVGTGIETSIRKLSELIAELSGKKVKIKSVQDYKRNYRTEVTRSLADISKIKALGWKPKISLREGLKETMRWYKNGPR